MEKILKMRLTLCSNRDLLFNASDFKKTEDYLFKALKIQNKLNDNTKEILYTYQFLSGLYREK